jgi:purine-binding chemotaxis protein CheW
MNTLQEASAARRSMTHAEVQNVPSREYVTMSVMGQLFGIPVLSVRDVLSPQRITRIPLAAPEVAGALNLRGRIVTAVDLRKRLGLPPRDAESKGMNVVVEGRGELYSLIVDEVGEVLSVPEAAFERNPPTLDARWREVSAGICTLRERLMVVLDIAAALRLATPA